MSLSSVSLTQLVTILGGVRNTNESNKVAFQKLFGNLCSFGTQAVYALVFPNLR